VLFEGTVLAIVLQKWNTVPVCITLKEQTRKAY